jgi:hypothetical protein
LQLPHWLHLPDNAQALHVHVQVLLLLKHALPLRLTFAGCCASPRLAQPPQPCCDALTRLQQCRYVSLRGGDCCLAERWRLVCCCHGCCSCCCGCFDFVTDFFGCSNTSSSSSSGGNRVQVWVGL